ncbi:1-acyl-sn-glycerol-3-phosphate acyltransferase delta-like [Bradysia coprophila]|uniref:1-acyl-sn-glycerol-3-phosphate acyltransferase delta-like n=1 Tax=Bradysia coprophila TaxID=38358 RepID=UPI00187D8D0C|nr:1-acyl-sn-glycerol-3-phosphate acyltransferase delta-like [Bradysia coprophila]
MSLLAEIKSSNAVHLCFCITYFISGLIINIVQCILFYGLRPINKQLYRRIGYYLIYSLLSQSVFFADWWSGSKLYLYCDEEVRKRYLGKEHTLWLMNHSYEIDFVIGGMMWDNVGALGNCKAYVKKIISYFPTLGWGWKFAEYIFLERSFEKDKQIIERQINEILDYPYPVLLLFYAEGTRFTEKKHEASVKFAQERGMPALKHHLIPRTRGFTTSLPTLRKKFTAILDFNIAFHKNGPVEPSVANLMHGRGVEAHLFIHRVDMKSVPDKEDEAAEWLQEMYRFKDKIQDSFHTHGDFFTGSGLTPIEPILVQRTMGTLLNMIFWTIVTLPPIVYYLISLMLNGKFLYFFIGISILSLFYILVQRLIGTTKISKGSSYGTSSTARE